LWLSFCAPVNPNTYIARFPVESLAIKAGGTGLARWSRITALSIVLYALFGSRVMAHPLGNFTINRLAIVTPVHTGLRVSYVLDIAEIPTFQIMHAGGWSNAQMRAWAGEEAARVAQGLHITANGTAVPLTLRTASAKTRRGAGGLPTLYWTGSYDAAIPARAAVAIFDSVYADRRVGWRDIILPGLPDPTNALRSYPNALIGSPRHNDRASFDLKAGRISSRAVSGASADAAWGVGSIVRSSALSDLFSRADQTPLLVILTILAAFGLGALHGLEPGHGKALLAFTLVGARATLKQAVVLAGALTFAHTIAVLLLGVLLFFAAGFATESIFTWITLISGIVVAGIGARSLARAVQHSAAHVHDHAHGHTHAIPGTAPLHFPSAVAAAMSGGIAPCPAAIVVLLTALHAHRLGYGLFVIVVFSLGLATILTGLGIAVVHGAAWLQRRSAFAAFARLAPILTAAVISTIGATMLAQGFVAQAVRLPAFGIVAFTLFAIALFALPKRRSHETASVYHSGGRSLLARVLGFAVLD
jgi:nickel/cobalt exporter